MNFLLQTDLQSAEPTIRFIVYLFLGLVAAALAILVFFSRVRQQIQELSEKLSTKYKERAEIAEKELEQEKARNLSRALELEKANESISDLSSELIIIKSIIVKDIEGIVTNLNERENKCKDIEVQHEILAAKIERYKKQINDHIT